MRPSVRRARRARLVALAIVVVGWPLAIAFGIVLARALTGV